ncbi:MAG TPA: M4 family metallopeptidase [Myxococcota bacterium]|nr:M4 family metallopeptidase [Myxococcota bacterium]HRY92756.1 M4 family metallopeptidase [Myxococcota bacterium]HSA21464.1 M4 family metallopeptidase [Myxococcota bacterium]
MTRRSSCTFLLLAALGSWGSTGCEGGTPVPEPWIRVLITSPLDGVELEQGRIDVDLALSWYGPAGQAATLTLLAEDGPVAEETLSLAPGLTAFAFPAVDLEAYFQASRATSLSARLRTGQGEDALESTSPPVGLRFHRDEIHILTAALTAPQDGAAPEGDLVDVLVATDWSGPSGQAASLTLFAGETPLLEREVALANGSGELPLAGVDLSPFRAAGQPAFLRAELLATLEGREYRAATAAVEVRFQRGAVEERALAELEAASARPVRVLVEEGRRAAIAFDLPAAGATRVEQAFGVLEQLGDLLGLEDPREELRVAGVTEDEDGEASVELTRRIDGVPVFGADLVVLLAGDRAVQVNTPQVVPPPRPIQDRVPLSQIMETIALELGQARLMGEPRLVYYNADLWRNEHERAASSGPAPTRLAWRLWIAAPSPALAGRPDHWEVFADAETGDLLDAAPQSKEDCPADDLDLDVLDADGDSADLCLTWFDTSTCCTEDGCDSGIPRDAEEIYPIAREVYDWYYSTLCRRGWDGTDGQIEFIVRYDRPTAAFHPGCDYTSYGPTVIDVDTTAHEFTHGVNHWDNELRYKNDSGAMDEGLADIFGAFVDGDHKGIGLDPHHASEGSQQDGAMIHDLSDPPRGGQPDHYDDYVVTSSDNGGVHTNGGILSKATWLLFAGGTHPKSHIPVESIGIFKLRKLWYSVLLHDITMSSRMYSFCGYAIQRAQRWSEQGTHGFTAADVCQVNNACAAVSRRFMMDLDCDGLPDGTDTDLDGLVDDRDNCPEVSNLLQEDIDGDWLGDACDPDDDGDSVEDERDTCPASFNPSQADLDADGAGDACDDDDDRDGVPDASDNCPGVYNSAQFNLDLDGAGDDCDDDLENDGVPNDEDNCPRLRNPMQADSDQDGVGTACDNCPGLSNPDQQNHDRDSSGDACDLDDDDDQVPDAEDNCPTVENPDQFDGDGNDVGFECDTGERTAALLERWNAGFEVMVALVERYGIQPRIPLPVRGGDDPDWVDPNALVTVTFRAMGPEDLPLAVVDQFGRVVARARATRNPDQTTSYTLTFRPRMDLDRVLPDGGLGASLGSRYHLQFFLAGQQPGEIGGTLSMQESLAP